MCRTRSTHGRGVRAELWQEILKDRDNYEDLNTEGRIILKYILNKLGGKCGLGSTGSGWGLVAGSCVHGSDFRIPHSAGIWLSNCWFLKND
jgi:hypothetical protein